MAHNAIADDLSYYTIKIIDSNKSILVDNDTLHVSPEFENPNIYSGEKNLVDTFVRKDKCVKIIMDG